MKRVHLRKEHTQLERILEGCRKKDKHSQELLFKQFAPVVFTACRRYGSSFYSAKDILQDAFITIFEKIHLYDPQKGHISSWMVRIAINHALNILRNKKLQFAPLNEATDSSNYLEPLGNTIETFQLSEERILALIASLPLGYRTVFNLYIIDGYTHKEIAEILGISVTTSKTQLLKAKKKLQAQIIAAKKYYYGKL